MQELNVLGERMKKTMVFIALIFVFLIVNIFGITQYQSLSGSNFRTSTDLFSVVLPLGGSMLLGILSSALVAALKQLPQDQAVQIRKLGSILLRPNTFIALLVSPVVFYGVLVSLGDGAIGPLVYLAAFQNGFFWQTALVPPGARSA